MSSVLVAFDADNPGRWAFHCHNLYHMATGMMTEVVYDTFALELTPHISALSAGQGAASCALIAAWYPRCRSGQVLLMKARIARISSSESTPAKPGMSLS